MSFDEITSRVISVGFDSPFLAERAKFEKLGPQEYTDDVVRNFQTVFFQFPKGERIEVVKTAVALTNFLGLDEESELLQQYLRNPMASGKLFGFEANEVFAAGPVKLARLRKEQGDIQTVLDADSKRLKDAEKEFSDRTLKPGSWTQAQFDTLEDSISALKAAVQLSRREFTAATTAVIRERRRPTFPDEAPPAPAPAPPAPAPRRRRRRGQSPASAPGPAAVSAAAKTSKRNRVSLGALAALAGGAILHARSTSDAVDFRDSLTRAQRDVARVAEQAKADFIPMGDDWMPAHILAVSREQAVQENVTFQYPMVMENPETGEFGFVTRPDFADIIEVFPEDPDDNMTLAEQDEFAKFMQETRQVDVRPRYDGWQPAIPTFVKKGFNYKAIGYTDANKNPELPKDEAKSIQVLKDRFEPMIEWDPEVFDNATEAEKAFRKNFGRPVTGLAPINLDQNVDVRDTISVMKQKRTPKKKSMDATEFVWRLFRKFYITREKARKLREEGELDWPTIYEGTTRFFPSILLSMDYWNKKWQSFGTDPFVTPRNIGGALALYHLTQMWAFYSHFMSEENAQDRADMIKQMTQLEHLNFVTGEFFEGTVSSIISAAAAAVIVPAVWQRISFRSLWAALPGRTASQQSVAQPSRPQSPARKSAAQFTAGEITSALQETKGDVKAAAQLLSSMLL